MTCKTTTELIQLQTYTGLITEWECEVHFEYLKAERGAREYGTGLALEPDYPAHVNLEAITFTGDDGKTHDLLPLLSKKEREGWEGRILEAEEQGEYA